MFFFVVDFITLYPHLDFKVDVDHNCRHLHIQSSMRPEVTGQTCTSGTKIFFNIINTINFSGSTALTPEAQTLKRTFGQVSSRAPTGLVCRRGSSSPRRPSWSSHHWPPESLHGLSPWRSPCWSTLDHLSDRGHWPPSLSRKEKFKIWDSVAENSFSSWWHPRKTFFLQLRLTLYLTFVWKWQRVM